MRCFPLLALLALAAPVAAAPCGGNFPTFLQAMRTEALALGLPESAVKAVLDDAQIDPAVIKADHAQGIFRKTFIDFSTALISKNRIDNAAIYGRKYDAAFATASAEALAAAAATTGICVGCEMYVLLVRLRGGVRVVHHQQRGAVKGLTRSPFAGREGAANGSD